MYMYMHVCVFVFAYVCTYVYSMYVYTPMRINYISTIHQEVFSYTCHRTLYEN